MRQRESTSVRALLISTCVVIGLVETLRGEPPIGADPAELTFAAPASQRDGWSEIDAPARDGWETEVLAEEAVAALKSIEALLTRPLTDVDVADLFPAEFRCADLRPETHVVFDDGIFVVRRPLANGGVDEPRTGPAGARDGFRDLLIPFEKSGNRSAEFKVVGVEKSRQDDRFATRLVVSLSGRGAQGAVEMHATWRTEWMARDDDSPRFLSISLEDYEEVHFKGGGPALFADCTEAVLSENECWDRQLLRGVNHWLQRMPMRTVGNGFGLAGIALGDVNGDGLDDLFLSQDAGIPNRLFLQNADGTLTDVSVEWGVDWIEDGRGALLVDLDNDGDQDLIVATWGAVVLAENVERRRFDVRLVLPMNEDTSMVTAADYDNDGRLDIYACIYNPDRLLTTATVSFLAASEAGFTYYDANNSDANILFRNETEAGGTWRFRDVTVEVGLDVNNRRYSIAAAWEDFDNDGDQDLYVANDWGRNCLYENRIDVEGRFVDVAATIQAEDAASGMSVSWGDYDRDGWVDLYIGNMFSAAGSRITTQDRFRAWETDEVRSAFRRFAKGNTLMRNNGSDGPFDDVSLAAHVNLSRWAWSSPFADINNDGWEDLLVANGYITSDDTGDL